MSRETEDQALDRGHDCAMSAVGAQRDVLANLPPAERLSWWVGFISAAMGAALASVGDAAMRVLKGALAERRDIPSPAPASRRLHTYLGHEIRVSKKKAS
jgi:hypothetical protein